MYAWVLFGWLSFVAGPAAAEIDANAAEQAQAAFFSGLDLQSAGDSEGAIARFQMALSHNPELHQARLYLADCFHQIGMDDQALAEVTQYLSVTFPGAETEKARKLFVEYGGDPAAIPNPAVGGVTVLTNTGTADTGTTDTGTTETGATNAGYIPSANGGGKFTPIPASADWSLVAVEVGLAGGHHANSVGLTVVGPAVGVRLLPWRYLEVGAGFRYGMGGYADHEGMVSLPSVGLDAAASIPLKRARLIFGVVVPVVISRYGDSSRMDAGFGGQAGVRGSVAGTRLVLGGVLEAGYLVRPFVSGSFRIGIQIGPLGGKS